jgi:hypothetical protein
MRDGVL